MSASALQLIDLHKKFGATPIIRGVSLDVHQGERHAIIGPNGAGKSSIFNCLNGVYRTQEGRIRFDGDVITGRRPVAISCRTQPRAKRSERSSASRPSSCSGAM